MTYTAPSPHLPDPDRQPQFYQGVASRRLIAWLVDSLITLALTLGVVLVTAFVGLLIWPFLFVTLGFAYRLVTLANGSATWGMRFAGIELRDGGGQRLDLGQAFLHTLGFSVCIALPIFQLISVVMMLTSARGQGLPDLFVNTVMLNRRATF
ncbi:RDD family protein [Pseudodonghicola xiamenensis]|uniref:RDD family protein n=1 Tax=Pseudodonghicola xiamenensis TaxID=337702 RepID=A0A8J3MCX7_9RHOB|nr:RDD family protein [Pseudodonghicola xiamenensis]GHG79962.1 RDD family protein [Pseudodonghicola xiamenensis]